MDALVNILALESLFFLIGLVTLVIYQMANGKINTRGMMSDELTGNLSPGRVQLLTVTLFSALFYFGEVLNNPRSLPPVPQELLLLLGGSSTIYLGGKASNFGIVFPPKQ